MMQYVLTETEYETLKAAPKLVEDRCYEALLQASRRIANAEIVKEGWYAGRIWQCMFDKADWYCDECPAADLCPYPYKEYSK
jgi:hypothetical protein